MRTCNLLLFIESSYIKIKNKFKNLKDKQFFLLELYFPENLFAGLKGPASKTRTAAELC